MRNIKNTNIAKDIIAGIVIALVSIPISMGYAQIAGLPVVYGLYGSLLPIFCYAFITTSPQFVVGIDAMPAVMVGALMAELGIIGETREAMNLAPLMAWFVAGWFIIFFVFKAGRVVKYISTPVMGGFISGVGFTIILMQIPKLFGGSAGTGELFDLIGHIVREIGNFNLVAFALGLGTVIIILVCKKIIPKVPMTAIMIIVGAALQYFIGLDKYGVKLLPAVTSGLPKFIAPDIRIFKNNIPEILIQSASIAAVIMAQTLLATGSYAMKHNDKIDNNRELLAYATMNLAGGAVGACPVNGSVSRSGMAESMGVRSQLMSIAATVTMLLVLLFGTPLLKYLPVPVLTGIVMTALIGILDFKLAKRLLKTNRNELFIFLVAFAGVLLFGTIRGVLIGVVLAFGEVAVRAVNPPVSFMGVIPGHEGFHSLKRNSEARPIKNTVIYRFSGNLFFANIDRFQSEIENAIKEDTKQIIVDARGIGTIDITAIDRLVAINRSLRTRGIHFYITEHDGSLNDQFRRLGGAELIENDAVRRTIALALRDSGLYNPYEYEGEKIELESTVMDVRLSEFEWLFGNDAEAKMEEMANEIADEIVDEISHDGEKAHHIEDEVLDGHSVKTEWGTVGLFDENGLLDYIENRLEELASQGKISDELLARLENHIEHRRKIGEMRLEKLNPHAIELMKKRREAIFKKIKEHRKLDK